MPKAILEFNLPEEQEEFNMVSKAVSYSIALSDMDNYLRGKIKYGSEEMTEEAYAIYEEIRKQLWEIMNDNDVSV